MEATSPAGATVDYTATATDVVDGAVEVHCAPAFGSTFPIEATPVSCSAADVHGNKATGGFTATVADRTPPWLHLPADVMTEATGPGGATVNNTASATDVVDGAVAPTCDPASRSVFSIATTPVGCSATDTRGNTDTGGFSVTARTPRRRYSWCPAT